MLNLKTFAMAAAVSAGVVFAMPAVSQAMPQSAPVKIDTATSGNVVDVRYTTRYNKRLARYCRYNWDDPRCHSNKYRYSKYRHRYRTYDEPYYGYGYYRPYRPGIGLQFRID